MNDRIELLHKGVLKALSDGEDFFSGKARLDLLAEEGFLEKSFILRKARMTEAVLDAADIRIYPQEILVGTLLKVWRGVDYTTFEERVKYADMNLAFPRRNNQIINGEKVYSSSPLKLSEEELRNPDTANWNWGHSCGGFERILEMGYLGIAEEAERKIEEMKAAGEIDNEKIEFWNALITVTKAVVRYSERYSEELSKMAESETDEKRKRELLKLSEITKKVPGRPAETFYEAVQSVWFAWMCSYKFNGTDLGRLDQYLSIMSAILPKADLRRKKRRN